MYKYKFSKESLKVLGKLNADIRKLKGEWKGFYRLKIGQIRVIFSIDDKNKILKVHEIGFRGDVYK
jgi:mRNA interferase RelE/StbE